MYKYPMFVFLTWLDYLYLIIYTWLFILDYLYLIIDMNLEIYQNSQKYKYT